MLNSGKNICDKKKNILTLVLSEKKILNETKNHDPPFKLNGQFLKLQNIKCVGFYWHFRMMFLLSGCCVMDSKSSTALVNISLNSGSEHKLT
jgi:hypothetical protein